MKNITDNGKKISKMDLEFIFGLNLEGRVSFWEIDMKDNGFKDKGLYLYSSIIYNN